MINTSDKRERKLAYSREYHKRRLLEDPEFRRKHIERSYKWNKEHRAQHSHSNKIWRQNNPDKVRAAEKRRRERLRALRPPKQVIRNHRSLHKLMNRPKPEAPQLFHFSPEIQTILDTEAEKQRQIALKRRQLIYGY